eukprot:gene11213-biopygen8090
MIDAYHPQDQHAEHASYGDPGSKQHSKRVIDAQASGRDAVSLAWRCDYPKMSALGYAQPDYA